MPPNFRNKDQVAKEEKALHPFRKFSTSSAEKCISSSPAASENLPVLLCKLNLNIFNTFSKLYLELSFASFICVVGTVLYCILKRKVL
jgi:hypothetical protein